MLNCQTRKTLTETRRTPRIRAGEAQTSAACHVPEGKQVTSLLNSWHGMLHVDEGMFPCLFGFFCLCLSF